MLVNRINALMATLMQKRYFIYSNQKFLGIVKTVKWLNLLAWLIKYRKLFKSVLKNNSMDFIILFYYHYYSYSTLTIYFTYYSF